jgi:uncharacterized protein
MPASGGRVASIDVLRGVAVLAMAVANVPLFATVYAAHANPTAYGTLLGPDWWAWLVSYVLVDGRFTAIFGMTFGAGIAILAERYGRAGLPVARIHYRRMAGLLVLGVLHAYLVWYGDFLVCLALCGSVAYIYRDVPPRKMLVVGMLIMAVATLVSIEAARSMPSWSAEQDARIRHFWAPPAEVVRQEIEAYRGGWLAQMSQRIPAALARETVGFAAHSFWQMTGLMLIGMALFKLGILSAAWSTTFYVAAALGGFGVGIPLVLYGMRENFASGWELRRAMLIDGTANYWGGFLVGAGWVALVMLVCRLGVRLAPVAAVGRLSLSNYLLQSILFTTIFYGHGLGLFADVGRAGQLLTALGVAAIGIIASNVWTRYFAVGPVEWLWRSATLGRRIPVRAPVDVPS